MFPPHAAIIIALIQRIEKDDFESVIDVDEEGQQASIYAKIDGDNNVFLLLAQDEETAVIIIYGSMTLEDIQGITRSSIFISNKRMRECCNLFLQRSLRVPTDARFLSRGFFGNW